MAKYCVKCGKAIPDGTERCPHCAPSDQAKRAAAPFTRITSETEVWKDNSMPVKKRRTPLRERFSTNRLVIVTSAVVVVLLAALTVVMTRPAVRVFNALNSGSYDKAIAIYSEHFLGAEAPDIIAGKLQKLARDTYSDLMDGAITADEGEEIFLKLFLFEAESEVLGEIYTEYTALRESRANAEQAALYESNGDYLAASDSYCLVIEADSRYAEAREASERCLRGYASKRVQEARELIAAEDFDAAIIVLEECDGELHSRDTFSEDVDELLVSCFADYEEYILAEAVRLAELEEYENAAHLIAEFLDRYDYGTEALSAKLAEYNDLAQKKIISGAVARSDEFYAQGSYAEAFEQLDIVAQAENAAEAMAVPIAALERRFADDMIARAAEAFANDTARLGGALEMVEGALEIRSVAKLEAYHKYLEGLVPVDMDSDAYWQKEGVIYRNNTDFECVDGTTYTEGWIWGENESSVTFRLDREYDRFTGVFAVRRAEGSEKQANFEVWLDGELAYTSDILFATESRMPFEIDVTGAQELRIVFYANYETSGTAGGYCSHGICTPVATKDIEPFEYEE